MNTGFARYGAALLLIATTVGISSGCVATRKFVRNETTTRVSELEAKVNEKDSQLESSIDANSGQISELSEVTREHGEQITTLDTSLKATDGKATQAMTVGQNAQTAANEVSGRVNTLDEQFQARNNYHTLSEEAVTFAFGSAKLDPNHTGTLDEVAGQLKTDANAILVLEGRTDSVGDDTYNIQLGEKRLDSVIRYLVVDQGVPMHKIYKMSFGAANPIAENNTREGRAKNRAVVLRLMGPGSNGAMMSNATSMQ